MYFRICIAFAALFAVSQAIVCTPNFCDSVQCKSHELLQSECVNGLVRESASLCGCCHACIHQLGEGAICDIHFFGVPKTSECAEGLTCRGNRCVRS